MNIYVAGPYTADTKEGIDKNIDSASTLAYQIRQRGHTIYCPHSATGHWDSKFGMTYDDAMTLHMSFLEEWADGIFMCPGWEESKGSLEELCYAKTHNKRVFFNLDDLDYFMAAEYGSFEVEE